MEEQEKSKYFTPDITDIRVGYECEHKFTNGWKSIVVEVDSRLKCWQDYIEEQRLRVSYLTQEQIEAEGWDVIGVYPNGATLHKKGKYELMFLEGCRLTITKVWKSFEGEPDEKTHRKDVYNGEGKCINELRQILKQIHITPFYGE